MTAMKILYTSFIATSNQMFSVVPTIKLAARKISYLIASFLSFLVYFTFLISLV